MIAAMMTRYWPKWSGTLQEGAGGWNNTTYFIRNEVRSCVLRIYNTHRDREKIEFEHAVLESLQQVQLSFKVPTPVTTLAGETIVVIEDGSGRYACLFEYIEGVSPNNGNSILANSFGEATGELSIALAKIIPEVPPAYRPYYELHQAYPNCSREVVLDFCNNPSTAFHDLHQDIQLLSTYYENICHSLAGLEELPQQLVHGDLNESNLLVHPDHVGQVTALLDFEFCTLDVRAMEPAVIISGLLGHEGEMVAVRRFCRAFGSRVRLSPEEVTAIPLLMILRKVDVFLHFMSRFFNGTDEPDVLRQQVQSLSADLKQLEYSQTWMEVELRALMDEPLSM
ncbi:Ser/Thr protein kinase RdoA (MazF antagonist) [Paenibacillus sp. DS2015]|uniref:phosphotransferase n=1 Tax=Paenibacillus sp. DS2015 TaxID=3373917 RepID=UPI003D225D62